MSEFRDLRTLIIDPAGHSKALLKRLLANLGVLNVVANANTAEALETLRLEVFSVVFCDEMVGPLNPFAFLKALRRDLQTCDVTVPIILVSSQVDISKIKEARDAGINDVVARPVSASTVKRKLRSLVFAPRSFVAAKEFIGPDRRRGGEERSQYGERRISGEDRRSEPSEKSIFAIGPRLGR